jgi:hypothetical protein
MAIAAECPDAATRASSRCTTSNTGTRRATETWNLVALCSADHRAHHAGKLHVSGNADHADGLVFTNELGTPISGPPPPTPPRGPAPRPSSTYRHPVGERMQMANLWFRPPALEPSTPSPPRPPPDPPPE